MMPADQLAPYLIAAGFILTTALVAFSGLRGLRWSGLLSASSAVVLWLSLAAVFLLRDGGTYENSRVAIWAGLLMVLPLVLAFYWSGGLFGLVAGMIFRQLVKTRRV